MWHNLMSPVCAAVLLLCVLSKYTHAEGSAEKMEESFEERRAKFGGAVKTKSEERPDQREDGKAMGRGRRVGRSNTIKQAILGERWKRRVAERRGSSSMERVEESIDGTGQTFTVRPLRSRMNAASADKPSLTTVGGKNTGRREVGGNTPADAQKSRPAAATMNSIIVNDDTAGEVAGPTERTTDNKAAFVQQPPSEAALPKVANNKILNAIRQQRDTPDTPTGTRRATGILRGRPTTVVDTHVDTELADDRSVAPLAELQVPVKTNLARNNSIKMVIAKVINNTNTGEAPPQQPTTDATAMAGKYDPTADSNSSTATAGRPPPKINAAFAVKLDRTLSQNRGPYDRPLPPKIRQGPAAHGGGYKQRYESNGVPPLLPSLDINSKGSTYPLPSTIGQSVLPSPDYDVPASANINLDEVKRETGLLKAFVRPRAKRNHETRLRNTTRQQAA